MKSHFVLEFNPHLSITRSRALCFHVDDLILVTNFILHILLPLLDTKHKVVFGYQTCSKPSGPNLVFVYSNHTVVAGEAVLLISAHNTCFSWVNINARLLNWEVLAFDKLPEVGQINHRLYWIRPLPSEQSSWWVFKVDCKKQGIFFIVIASIYVSFQSDCVA